MQKHYQVDIIQEENEIVEDSLDQNQPSKIKNLADL
jgi:hypothetical protein